MRFNFGTLLLIILVAGAILWPISFVFEGLAKILLLLVWSIITAGIIAYVADRDIKRAIKERNHGNTPKS